MSLFHEGLFWHCSLVAVSHEHSFWDLWICESTCTQSKNTQHSYSYRLDITAAFPPPSASQPSYEVCQAAFLFPFPLIEPRPWVEQHGLPTEPYEHRSAIGWCLHSTHTHLTLFICYSLSLRRRLPHVSFQDLLEHLCHSWCHICGHRWICCPLCCTPEQPQALQGGRGPSALWR